MDAIIYDNMGVLGHEKQHVYTTAPAASASWTEPFYIIIPDAMNPYTNESGDIVITPSDNSGPWLLSEALETDPDGMPSLRWIDKDGTNHRFSPGTYAKEE